MTAQLLSHKYHAMNLLLSYELYAVSCISEFPGLADTLPTRKIVHFLTFTAVQEVENSRGNVMLFIDEIHTLIGAGAVRYCFIPMNRPKIRPNTSECLYSHPQQCRCGAFLLMHMACTLNISVTALRFDVEGF